MLLNSKKRLLAAMVGGLLTVQAAQAALVVDESFRGGWYNPQQSGRGSMLDWLQTSKDGGVLFVATFTYDTTGKQYWFTTLVPLTDREFKKTGVDALTATGGTFGNNYTPTVAAPIGKVDFEANSCNRITLSFTPNQGSNLVPVTLDLSRPDGVPATCQYTREFTTCPTGTTAVAGLARTCQLPSTITGTLRLTNEATYLIAGKTQVGSARNTNPGTLIIEPGTQLQGKGGAIDYLVVNAGSKIFAEGTKENPIVFTGPTNVPGSWAGLVLAGNAADNTCRLSSACTFEADADVTYGGVSQAGGGNLISDDADSTGVLKYVQIRYAGQEIRPNEELNALTMLGVGSGTTIENVSVYAGKDDAFEWFGGAVNARYLVAIATEDDCLDTANGYRGRVQFAYCKQTATAASGSHAIESDNNGSSFDLLPRTQPKMANLTFIQSSTGDEAIRIRRGAAGNYFNVVAKDAPTECLNFNDAATFNASGSAANPIASGFLTMTGAALGCNTNFELSGSDPFQVDAWFNIQAANLATNAAGLNMTGRFPNEGSPLLNTGVAVPNDAFFQRTSYKGAFDTSAATDWTQGWSYGVE